MYLFITILGPSSSGNSDLAIRVATKLGGEVVSLDSALIYRGMDIGTAKPTMEERAGIPHHLIDICDPAESYSAARFRTDCIATVGEITARGRVPIICGGTMLYYKTLVEGISPVPATDPAVRARVSAEGERLGWPAMHRRLEQIDPDSFQRLAPNDKQRVSRALEVYCMTGRPIGYFYGQKGERCPFPMLDFVVMPKTDRSELRSLIRARFMGMLQQGLIEEVARLRERADLNLALPSMRCVGYRQVWEYLDGRYGEAEMIERSVIATAHLAKHQMTWLRGGLRGDRVELEMRAEDNSSRIAAAYLAAA